MRKVAAADHFRFPFGGMNEGHMLGFFVFEQGWPCCDCSRETTTYATPDKIIIITIV